MPSANDLMNVVDESGKIIGTATRGEIHRQGLLHREINVWFYTPKGEIIFQRRGSNKDTYPNLLDATAGGHVDIGDDFESAALREIEEEIGLKVKKENLQLYKIIHTDFIDPVTKNRNNALRAIYAYLFEEQISELKKEAGEADGFEVWLFEKLKKLSPTDAAKFCAGLIDFSLPCFEALFKA